MANGCPELGGLGRVGGVWGDSERGGGASCGMWGCRDAGLHAVWSV